MLAPVEIKYYIVVFDLVAVPLIMIFTGKNITDSPRCICNAVETCSHFLLNCPLYVNQRHHHLNNIPCALTLNNLLYGDEHLTFEQNKNIFLCVQRYIASTNRFGA